MKRAQAASQTDDIDDGFNAKEDDPCLPVATVSKNNTLTRRKSLETLNKTRDNQDEHHNTTVLETEKNKNINNTNNYKIQQTITTPTIVTTPPPPANTSTNAKKFRTVTFNPPTSKFEQWCSEKTGLSRIGLLTLAVLLLILFILFITVLVMSSLWPGVPHSALFPICRTPACLLASSEVIAKMNQSVSACEDIRDYSCGHWLNTHTIPSHESFWGMKRHMQLKHREHLRNLIMTMKLPQNAESVEWKIKNTYDSCMSLGTIETEGILPLSKHISELGGWHIMKEFSVNMWDMKLTLKNLHKKYDVHPFFKIDVIPDPRVPAQSIVQISPGKLGLPEKSYYYRSSSDKIIIAYKWFLKDIASLFGATLSYANTFSEDMFGFERRLTERFPSNLHVDGFRALHRTTLGDLETHAPSINLYDIISYMFTDVKITKKTEVVVVAPDYLVNVSQIFSTTDRIILNNYMMLKLVFKYMPFLSNSFRTTLFEFHKQLYGVKETVPRWETCIKTLQKYMGRGLEAILENSNGEGEKKKQVAADLFEHIRITLRNNVMNSNNIPSHIKEHFLEKLDQMTVQIGLKVEMKRPEVYNKYYYMLSSIKDAFFSNVFLSVTFQLEKRIKRLGQHNEDARWVDGISDGSLRVIYIPELNKVAIPMALLATPYFHPHYPLSILYGTLGVEIGEAVISGLIGEGVYYSGDGLQLPDDHPVHAKKYDCLIEEQASASTRHLYAVTATYKALKDVLAELPHVHQPALEYLENEALYFIAYAQSLCTMKTPEQQDLDITTAKSKMDDLNLLDILMHRSKEFSTTFNCRRKLKKDSCDVLVWS